VQFLLFSVITVEKCFGQILMTFLSPENTGEGKVENWAQMSRFYTRNILTLFEVQFLSFHVNTTKKYFSRILTTFLRLDTTGASKVENQAQMTRFCTRNIPMLVRMQFLSFPVTAEKCFSRILTTFSGPDTTGASPQ